MSPTLDGWKRSRNAFLIDRCLPPRFALALSKFPVQVLHLADAYPGRAEHVLDPEWIRDAGERGFATITANPRMLMVAEEMREVRQFGAHIFCLANPDHTVETKAMIVGRHYPAIVRRAAKPGACFWRLDPQGTRYDIP